MPWRKQFVIPFLHGTPVEMLTFGDTTGKSLYCIYFLQSFGIVLRLIHGQLANSSTHQVGVWFYPFLITTLIKKGPVARVSGSTV